VGQSTGSEGAYIIKFFFIILGILVTVGVLGFVANIDNRKDTLLYAKFIADVGK
jgi:hypothetical protein